MDGNYDFSNKKTPSIELNENVHSINQESDLNKGDTPTPIPPEKPFSNSETNNPETLNVDKNALKKPLISTKGRAGRSSHDKCKINTCWTVFGYCLFDIALESICRTINIISVSDTIASLIIVSILLFLYYKKKRIKRCFIVFITVLNIIILLFGFLLKIYGAFQNIRSEYVANLLLIIIIFRIILFSIYSMVVFEYS